MLRRLLTPAGFSRLALYLDLCALALVVGLACILASPRYGGWLRDVGTGLQMTVAFVLLGLAIFLGYRYPRFTSNDLSAAAKALAAEEERTAEARMFKERRTLSFAEMSRGQKATYLLCIGSGILFFVAGIAELLNLFPPFTLLTAEGTIKTLPNWLLGAVYIFVGCTFLLLSRDARRALVDRWDEALKKLFKKPQDTG